MGSKLGVAVLSVAAVVWAGDAIAPLGQYRPAERRHWSFQKRADVSPPKFADGADRAWVHTPVDAFILARLRKEGLRPAPPADRRTLIRRAYFDLLGLPPSPAEVEAFVQDPAPDAWSRLVDRLLADPRYGERWGQHWLDVVRYADTDGFEYDTHRPAAWRYRDYVIRAFNNDKPYNRFILEQLAGDELSPQEDETVIAAGFNRLAPLRKNAGNQAVASSRNEVLTEMTNIVGSALLGVTLGCARCHDHKFDPFRQSDYYRMQGFFAETWDQDVPRFTPQQEGAWKAQAGPVEEEVKAAKAALRNGKPEEKAALEKQLEELQERLPPPLPTLFSVADDEARRSAVHLLARGDYSNQGDRVGMRVLGVLLPDGAPELPADTPKPRLKLAEWVASPDNPLTARVMVNRIWEYHFGRGIVGTPNDFGRMGERPTHPELLDWLADQFVSGGWSVKRIHRLILLSSAYQQSSAPPDAVAALQKDPDNRLYWKFSRRRLDAEEIRDAMLAIAGNLNPQEGGPGAMVPIDPELTKALYTPSQWKPDPAARDRRSVYLIEKRNLRLPFMEVFDQPDTQVSCPRRESSTHAPQALELLNGDLSNREAGILAQRLTREAGGDPARQVDLAFQLAAGRAPSLKEKEFALRFLERQPLREFALAVFNLNAFLYVN